MSLYRPGRVPSQEACDRFLAKLRWNAGTMSGEIEKMQSFRIDVFEFTFPDGMDENTQYRFFGFLQNLDLTQLRATLKTGIWLEQNNIGYSLGFRWNRDLPVWYNIKNLRKPKQMAGDIARLKSNYGDELRRYDLLADGYGIRPDAPCLTDSEERERSG